MPSDACYTILDEKFKLITLFILVRAQGAAIKKSKKLHFQYKISTNIQKF